MVVVFGAVIDHGHDIGVVSLVVIVKGIKEEAQAIPQVWGTKHWALNTLLSPVPEGLPK